MSYEYFSEININEKIQLGKFFESGIMWSLVEVLYVYDSVVQLRWRGDPKRTEWPEDITVTVEPNGILISFHAATASRRDEFLSVMKNCFLEFENISVDFEEL